MPATLTKIELKGAKIVETPVATGTAVNANRFDAIVAALQNAKEIDNNEFNLDPSTVDEPVSMGNIDTADVLVLVPDGEITVKLSGSLTAHKVTTALILFGTDITSITASNPSTTEVRSVKKYLATTTA